MKYVGNAHNKAIREIDANIAEKKRLNTLKNETYMTKEMLKEAQDKLKTEENKANVEHKEIIALEEKCRKFSQLLRDHNRGEQVVSDLTPEINKDELDDLEKELK